MSLQLQQPVQAQIADAIELALLEARPDRPCRATSSRPRAEIPLERRQAEHRRVVADVGVELRADPRQRFVHVERRPIAAALVEHVGGDRGEPWPVRPDRTTRRPAPAASTTTSGTWRCSTVQTRRPLASVDSADRREA